MRLRSETSSQFLDKSPISQALDYAYQSIFSWLHSAVLSTRDRYSITMHRWRCVSLILHSDCRCYLATSDSRAHRSNNNKKNKKQNTKYVSTSSASKSQDVFFSIFIVFSFLVFVSDRKKQKTFLFSLRISLS